MTRKVKALNCIVNTHFTVQRSCLKCRIELCYKDEFCSAIVVPKLSGLKCRIELCYKDEFYSAAVLPKM